MPLHIYPAHVFRATDEPNRSRQPRISLVKYKFNLFLLGDVLGVEVVIYTIKLRELRRNKRRIIKTRKLLISLPFFSFLFLFVFSNASGVNVLSLNGSGEHVYIKKDSHLTEISDHE